MCSCIRARLRIWCIVEDRVPNQDEISSGHQSACNTVHFCPVSTRCLPSRLSAPALRRVMTATRLLTRTLGAVEVNNILATVAADNDIGTSVTVNVPDR